MSHFEGPQKDFLSEQNIALEQNIQNNKEVTIILPILPFQNEEITQKSISQEKQKTITVQLVTTGQNQEAKSGTQMHQKIRPLGKNFLTLRKNYRQLININRTTDETSNNNDADMTLADKLHRNRQSFERILPIKQFHRTDLRNNRRSLHVIMRQNDDTDNSISKSNNNGNALFSIHSKKVINQQYTQRRYPEQGVNDKQRSQVQLLRGGTKQTTRKSLITSINNNNNNNNNVNSSFIKNSSHKRYQWQSLAKLDDQIYNHPEKNQQRTVVFIKTYIISPFQSVCIQLSLLKGSLIIAGNLFGEENQTIKMVVNQEKTEKLFNESFRDWDVLGKRVFVQMGSGGRRIRIGRVKQNSDGIAVVEEYNNNYNNQLKQNNNNTTTINTTSPAHHQRSLSYTKRISQMRKKQIFHRQKQFIRRNYYSIITKSTNTNETITTTVHHESNRSTINHPLRKRFQTIQHIETVLGQGGKGNYSKLKTPYFINHKHIDYLSPQVQSKVQLIQKQKLASKDQIQVQKIKKQNFIKKQKLFTQRISQFKNKKQHSQPYQNTQLSKQQNKTKGKPFAILKAVSLNKTGQNALQNHRQMRIQFNKLQKRVDEENSKVIENDNPHSIQQENIRIQEINQKQQGSQQGSPTSSDVQIRRVESPRGSIEQYEDEGDQCRSSCKDLNPNSERQIENSLDIDISFTEKVECNKKGSEYAEQEYKLDKNKNKSIEEYVNQFQDDEHQPAQEQEPSNNSQIKSAREYKIMQQSQQQLIAQSNQYSAFIREVEDDEYVLSYQNLDQREKSGLQSSKEKEHKIQSQYGESFERELERNRDDDEQYEVVDGEGYVFDGEVGQCDEVIQQEEDYAEEEFIEEVQ